jgi:hypothetical protein
MNFSLSLRTKILVVIACFAIAIYGFMVKLPSAFRHYDKELHSLFYFLAAAGLNILFAKQNIIKHLVIFAVLYLFGVAIEYAQEYSNKLFHKRIHGRYDVEDLQSNLKGLIACSVIWIICVGIWYAYQKATVSKAVNNAES